jgi:hypothetical protein
VLKTTGKLRFGMGKVYQKRQNMYSHLRDITLESEGFHLKGNRFRKGRETFLPLYEAKMVHHFDHRFGDYREAARDTGTFRQIPGPTVSQYADPNYEPLPRYWVMQEEVEARLEGRWSRGWLMGWRDITSSVGARTVIAALLSRVGVGHKLPLMMLGSMPAQSCVALYANLCSFALDYLARQKVGGTSLTYFYLKQLPVIPPATYDAPCPWAPGQTLKDWILPRVLELVYTAHDLEPFARDCGYSGPPFPWDEERRFLLRCELDAAFFHLYGIGREDVEYIMETFPIVKKHDEKKYGEYRLKRKVMEGYDTIG